MNETDSPDDDAPETLSERKELFLGYIEGGARYNEAAEKIGLSRMQAWRWKKQDPVFVKRLEAARKVSVAKLRQEAERRAMAGSDKLLVFLLCNYAPEQFQERQTVDHRGKVDLAGTIAQARKRIGEAES